MRFMEARLPLETRAATDGARGRSWHRSQHASRDVDVECDVVVVASPEELSVEMAALKEHAATVG